MPPSSRVLSAVPTLLMVGRFTDSGVSTMIRLPTAMTGAAAGRTNAAASSPTPTAMAALSTPSSPPTHTLEHTGSSWQRRAHRVITKWRLRPERALEALGRLREAAAVGTGREVLPPAVTDDEGDVTPLAARGHPIGDGHRGVQDRAAGDAGEDAFV